MTLITRHIERSGLERLNALEGTLWESLGSVWPMTNGFLEAPVSVASDSCNLALNTVLEYFAVDDDEFSFSSIRIDKSGSEFDQSRRDGNVYFHGKGEPIGQILVVRETLCATYQGNTFLEADIDFGVVFVLENSVIGISKRGFHGEDFVVSRASSIDELQFFDSAKEWSQSLMVRYEFGRKLFKVSELLSA